MSWTRIAAATGLLLLGLARGTAGALLALHGHAAVPNAPGSDSVIGRLGLILVCVSLIGVVASILVFQQRRSSRRIAASFLLLPRRRPDQQPHYSAASNTATSPSTSPSPA